MSTEKQSAWKGTSAERGNKWVESNDQEGVEMNEDEVLNAGELTNNDGSVVETLDTAFHDLPGYIKDHSMAGSNRADYYEAREEGKRDSEEELDYLRNQPSDKE